MPRIHTFDFSAWTGALLMPTAKGSRPSQIRTSALCADALNAWLMATRYVGLVSASAGYVVEAPGGTPLAGVRVAAVTITTVRKVLVRNDDDNQARTHQLDAVWELVV